MRYRGDRVAPGAPGIEPRWEHGDKSGVGTAYSGDSKVWYTLWRGIVSEVYYPLIDHPQLRDVQFLITDGRSFFHEERRHLQSRVELLDATAPGYRATNADPEGRYHLEKEVIADPHLPVLLQRMRLHRRADYHDPLTVFVLAAPHLDVGGAHNSGYVVEAAGRTILLAERGGVWLALGASPGFSRASCGYVGTSDGWTDLHAHLALSAEFDRAPDGNIALTGELPATASDSWTVGLAFGRGAPHAVASLLQSLGTSYEDHRRRFLEQWHRARVGRAGLASASGDEGRLLRASHTTLLAHEDKTFPGAFVASLAIPWGNARNDADRGGYHLVWTRDLCQIATGLLAAGTTETPLRTLIYLAASQRSDGGFPQNFWLDGDPYWGGVQLDEVSFPVLLAEHLARDGALGEFDPWPMVRSAAHFLVEHGPATGQERWEEAAGYSPSTLAAHISALVVAGEFARKRNDSGSARFLEEQADFLSAHLEGWTVTSRGGLHPTIPRHYLRILPVDPDDPTALEDPDSALLELVNQPPDAPETYPARDVVDAGFLELVRLGVRPALDPLVAASVEVVDHALRVETPFGPSWRRYTHDGYGQRDNGDPFAEWGVGRAWPLLTGERGHYELARGRDAAPYLRALERFAGPTGLLPEQVWDRPDLPAKHLAFGRPTGAAMPLAWAHAEYLKLLRSVSDGAVFDRIPQVEARYARGRPAPRAPVEVWKFRRQPHRIARGATLRVQAEVPFRLHASTDGWATVEDVDSVPVPIGFHYVDLAPGPTAPGPIEFTFYWTDASRWEGKDYRVLLDPPGTPRI